jgi:hypothetical protein
VNKKGGFVKQVLQKRLVPWWGSLSSHKKGEDEGRVIVFTSSLEGVDCHAFLESLICTSAPEDPVADSSQKNPKWP